VQSFKSYLAGCLGSVYVWGGQGEIIPGEAWIRARENKQGESAVRRAVAFYQRRAAALRALDKEDEVRKLRAFDCSGLIVRYMLDAGLIKSDMTAAGLYSMCVKFAAKELGAGDLVFRHNGERIAHVGVYMGDGTVIEARGRDYGVVRTAFSPDAEEGDGRGWTHFGRIPALSELWADAGDSQSPAEETPPAPSAADGGASADDINAEAADGGESDKSGTILPCFAFVMGGAVNVRAEAGIKGRVIAVAHRGDLLIAGRTENGFTQAAAYILDMSGGRARQDGVPVAGFISEKYIKRLNG
jgi:cell wall-associated NlpC family hydrolase